MKLLKLLTGTVLSLCMLAPLTSTLAAAAHGSADEAMALAKKAVKYYKANGREKALAEFSKPNGEFVDRDLYITATGTDGVTVAHGANAKLVGKNLMELKDVDGKAFIKSFVEVANTKGSGWVDYKWPNPVTKVIEQKSTYVEKVDNLVITCGIYK
jgi:cytochrome c